MPSTNIKVKREIIFFPFQTCLDHTLLARILAKFVCDVFDLYIITYSTVIQPSLVFTVNKTFKKYSSIRVLEEMKRGNVLEKQIF